ncbi:MAG TPA: hypothetical protein VFL61_05220 [Gaiellaceae bacterium]|nr:hypothetical protein [Gaiellaceae bacterium]
MTVVLQSARSGRADTTPSIAGRAIETTTIGLVGTYPPTKCGIATFTASLARGLASCARLSASYAAWTARAPQ